MPKTYGTVSTFTAGSVLTAAQLNTVGTAVNNLIVPPACSVVRTSDLTSYSTGNAITWSSAAFDTDGMFSAGTPTLITAQTAGIYVITFTGELSATATVTRVLVNIQRNGSQLAFQDSQGISTGCNWSVSVIASLGASDTLGGAVYVTGGSAYVIRGNSSVSGFQTRLTATWIGRTS